MNEHAKLLDLLKFHMNANSKHKVDLVCQLLADLGEERFRRVGR